MITVAVMLNVTTLNYAYDIPAKSMAVPLLAAATLIALLNIGLYREWFWNGTRQLAGAFPFGGPVRIAGSRRFALT